MGSFGGESSTDKGGRFGANFEAPVGLLVFIDKGMPKGSWLDIGLFVQNFLIAAENLGLSTCAQASFADYPDVVRAVLSLQEVDIICGIALLL